MVKVGVLVFSAGLHPLHLRLNCCHRTDRESTTFWVVAMIRDEEFFLGKNRVIVDSIFRFATMRSCLWSQQYRVEVWLIIQESRRDKDSRSYTLNTSLMRNLQQSSYDMSHATSDWGCQWSFEIAKCRSCWSEFSEDILMSHRKFDGKAMRLSRQYRRYKT